MSEGENKPDATYTPLDDTPELPCLNEDILVYMCTVSRAPVFSVRRVCKAWYEALPCSHVMWRHIALMQFPALKHLEAERERSSPTVLDEIGGDDGRTDWFRLLGQLIGLANRGYSPSKRFTRSLYEGDSDDELDEHRPVPRGPVVALRPFVIRPQALEAAPARAGALAAPPRGRARPWVATF